MTTSDNSYSEDELRSIWRKAAIVPGNDPDVIRKDVAGAWIRFSDYGNRDSKTNFGWEVDHIIPESKHGPRDINNLRPLHWANNVAKSDSYPNWKPSVTSEGDHNIEK